MGHKTQPPTTQNDRESAGAPPAGSEPVFFFKIVLPPALQDYKLSIPNKFVKEFSKDLSSMAKLVVPATQSWTVRIHSEGGKMCFSDGLRELFEYYSVSCGYLFVFDYRGNSEFGVRIFDLTTCEIKYRTPLLNEPELLIDEDEDPKEDMNCDGDGDGDGDDVVVLDRPMAPGRVDDVIALSSDDDDDDVFEEKPNVRNNISLNNGPSTRKRKMEFGTEGSNLGRRREVKDDHSPKNASFEVELMPHHIDTPLLNIPGPIGRKYPKGGNRSVTLEVSGGKTWTVEGKFLKARLTSLGDGWLKFVRDNKLKVDKTCKFELIECDKEFRMKVSVHNTVGRYRRE